MASPGSPPPLSEASDKDILTPGRKVQALLAQYDDSDSDNAVVPGKVTTQAQREEGRPAANDVDIFDSEDEDDAPVIVRKSRMAARLGAASALKQPLAFDSDQLPPIIDDAGGDADSDDVSLTAPRRRFLTKRKSSPAVRSSPPVPAPSEPPSPMFFPSPTRSHISRDNLQEDELISDPPQSNEKSAAPKSRFLALVEKQKKVRLEKEEAERAKRAARQASLDRQSHNKKRQRGSSPGDDSHESSQGSDAEAARNMAKRAKPTRKASKKAIEEMKRETQRMSRNTQLAYQAQVKKKITIESFVARFNRGATRQSVEPTIPEHAQSSSVNSAANSDSEPQRTKGTPPTSPLQLPQKDFTEVQSIESVGDDLVQEAPSLTEIGLDLVSSPGKGKGKADGEASSRNKRNSMPDTIAFTMTGGVTQPAMSADQLKVGKRAKLAEYLASIRATTPDDVDDDLDIITVKGDIRKYAAFEKLSKHKAKETNSHLALRTLAHIHERRKDKKSTMTGPEMQSNLRKAARQQAREERQQRIDELRAKGHVIQTVEERDRDQQEVEDLVEKARQEAAEIFKREKELAKKDGTFVKDALDDDDSDDDEEFVQSEEDPADSEDEDENDDAEDEDGDVEDDQEGEDLVNQKGKLFDDQADEDDEEEEEIEVDGDEDDDAAESTTESIVESHGEVVKTPAPLRARNARVISDDEDDGPQHETPRPPQVETPRLPQLAKTPQSILTSARKQIPGLHMSDDLPLGLTQAFDATMADTQTQTQQEEQDTIDYVGDLPSPGLAMMPRLNRLESLELISDSQPGTQTQPLNISLSLSQSQIVPDSPSLSRQVAGTQATPSRAGFEPTQDNGYMYSPFHGERFTAATPTAEPHSTIDTVPLHEVEASPVLIRKGRLRRGRAETEDADDEELDAVADKTAFEVMRKAAKKAELEQFNKTKSKAKDIVDEAAEESDDEYAGLGGVSDDDMANDVENEDDRRLIDDDTQVGKGDEAALAGFYADRERKSDEVAVTKLYQDIKTGKLRNRRAVNGDLDLSDEEDDQARRREAKRREFAKMRRELLKDEAVGKIAEDRKKEAFLRSIEDRHEASDDDDLDIVEPEDDSQSQDQTPRPNPTAQDSTGSKRKRPLETTSDSQLNRLPPALRRSAAADKKPQTLAEIRENLSFLIEEDDSQHNPNTLDLSESEDEPEAYVNLDRHFAEAEADEAAAEEDAEGLGDFVVDDEDSASDAGSITDDSVFKKPSLPASTSINRSRNPHDRRAGRSGTVINRLATLQRSSSTSSTGSGTSKLAFTTNNSSTASFRVPSLLRRATTNSSLSSMSSENISATGVSVANFKSERGHVSEEKVFVRKGMSGRRNAVNWQGGERPTARAEKGGVVRVQKRGKKGVKGGREKGGVLGELLRGETWG